MSAPTQWILHVDLDQFQVARLNQALGALAQHPLTIGSGHACSPMGFY